MNFVENLQTKVCKITKNELLTRYFIICLTKNAYNSSAAGQPFAEHLFLKNSLEIRIVLLSHLLFQTLFLLLNEMKIQEDLVN